MPPVPASVGSSPLDAPPPSPTAMGAQGGQGPFSPAGLVPPQGQPPIPSNQIPPEMLTGIMSAMSSVTSTLDAVAQALPDKGTQVNLIKELLARLMADITTAGSGPTSPTAPGPSFPGGGIDRGAASAGPV